MGGARVRRATFFGEPYDEELSLDPAHVRLERQNAGAPFLKVHELDTLDAVIGSVVLGSARIENGRGIALVRISERADVEPIWRDILAGHIRAVSIGYQVHRFEVSKPEADLDAFTRILAMYANSIAPLESDVVWGIITANPAMADGNALFHTTHKNLAGTGTALAVDAVGAARAAMWQEIGSIQQMQECLLWKCRWERWLLVIFEPKGLAPRNRRSSRFTKSCPKRVLSCAFQCHFKGLGHRIRIQARRRIFPCIF